jgi:hypothetical protein
MAKIVHNIRELNFLAGDGASEVVKRADGAHVLKQPDPLPVAIYRNGLLVGIVLAILITHHSDAALAWRAH